MEIARALEHIAAGKQPGTLVTLFADGRPQMSVVTGAVVDGALWISATKTRVKTANVRRDPRVVFASGIRPWVAVEGRAIVHDGADVLERLRRYYRAAAGEHPDWDEYDRAMTAEQRLIIEVRPARVYGSGF